MATDVDLGAYFHRVGYTGPREPTLSVLRDIVLAHSCSIPFENLDVLLGRGVSLAEADVDRKLIRGGRGGYCFEQNSLLLRVLTALGFQAVPLAARVRLHNPPGFIAPRTHLFLRVEIDRAAWLADVGIGGLSPTGPFRLDQLDAEQAIPHEPRRVVRAGEGPVATYLHQARPGDAWVDVYEFTLEEMPPIDRELANWWTSTHPESRFRKNLTVALARRDGSRVSILNREFTHRRGTLVLERFSIAGPDELRETLATRFGLVFPPDTRFGPPDSPWPS